MHQSRAGTLTPEEPDELMAHVRVCGGAGWVTTGSTRKFQTVDIAAVIGTLMGRQSSSPGCVATGNQGASCSRQPRPLGLPLNPLECAGIYPHAGGTRPLAA